MKIDFLKFSNGDCAFSDEEGKINLIKCDKGEDFAYVLLCKEEELEGLECENRTLMNVISRIRGKEKNRKKGNLCYIVIVPLALFIFFTFKPISLGVSLISSLGMIGGWNFFVNHVCGKKKDNKTKLDYAKRKYNKNREKIPVLRDEIEMLKKESNFRIVNGNNRDTDTDNKYEFMGNRVVHNTDIVHKARILSYKKYS